MQKTGYLPHIDGLRAIAITLVVLFHAGLGSVTGGFVGVDLFFVLSGFLITGQIAHQINNRNFSFQNFYLQRFRRLLPAYIVVAVVTLVAGYFLLLPEDYLYHAKLAGAAFFSLGNFYLLNTTEGYFATDNDEVPMLHTWSLSVEEQFYLLWPMLLLLTLRRSGGWRQVALLLTFFAASLFLSQWQAIHEKSQAYYLLPARFFELLTGALLAIYIRRLPLLGKVAATGISVAGLGLVLYSGLFLTRMDPFPGLNAIPVCLGTALLVYAGQFRSPVGSLLSSPPFVGLGKISYSLYLWHWPVFAFIQYEAGELTPVVAMVAIAVSVAASAVSWKWVENPLRFRWKFSFARTLVGMYLIPGLLFALVVLLLNKTDGLPQRFGVDLSVVRAMESKPVIHQEKCNRQEQPECRQILLIGDSHAAHFSPFLHALIEESGDATLKLDTRWKPFCPPVANVFRASIDKNSGEKTYFYEDNACYRMVNGFYQGLADSQYDYVVLGDFWSKFAVKEDFLLTRENNELTVDNSNRILRAALYDSIRKILAHNITPVIIKDNPAISKPLLKCSFKKVLKEDFPHSCEIPAAEVDQQQAYALQLFADIARDFPQVRFIDARKVLCSSESCVTTRDGMPLYHDKNHLTDPGSRMLGRQYLREVGNPFAEAVGSTVTANATATAVSGTAIPADPLSAPPPAGPLHGSGGHSQTAPELPAR